MSRPEDQTPDAVAAYLDAYMAAVESDEEPPSLDDLDDATRAQVVEMLQHLGWPGPTLQVPDDDAARAQVVEGVQLPEAADVSPSDAAPPPVGETGAGGRPRAESDFALAHGFVRPAPDVVVVGPAVRRARTASALTISEVVGAMSRRGSDIDGAALDDIERAPTYRMVPRDARLLAAVLDLPLAAIEATAEAWPADESGLGVIRRLGVHAVALEGVAVMRTERGDYLGLLRCSGDADMLDSRTYREAAAERLTGRWSHLAGVVLIAEQPPHEALAVDALDCVTRAHAPTGLSGFSRLSQPEPLAQALASYDQTYAVHWSDPEPLAPVAGESVGPRSTVFSNRIEGLAERLANEARRARQLGKRPGYEAAARWLQGMAPQDLADVLDGLAELAGDDPDEAGQWLEEVIPP